jgi:hypothetical protein
MTSSIRSALQEDRRKKYLAGLINEAIIQILSEQDAGAMPAGLPAPAAPPADVSAPPSPEAPAPGQPKEFTVDDMIERLNVIRGGRSFTDPEVYGQLVTFFKKQTDEQKQAIEAFLVEIGKIVINVNEQETPPGGDMSAAPPATTPPATEVPPTPAAPPPAV